MGNFIIRRQLTIPKDDVAIVLYLFDEKNMGRAKVLSGQHILALQKKNKTDTEIRIVTSTSKLELKVCYKALKTYIEDAEDTERLTEINISDGQTLTVATEPLGEQNALMRYSRLNDEDPYTAQFKAHGSKGVFGRLAIIFGACGIIGLVYYYLSISLLGYIFLGFMVIPFIGLCIYDIMFSLFNDPCVTADKNGNSIRIKSGFMKFGPKKLNHSVITFNQIAGLQLCADKEDSFMNIFELNLILREPRGERVNVVINDNEEHIRQDAMKFADFLSKPLFDHIKPLD